MSTGFKEDFLLLVGKMLWLYVHSEKVRMHFTCKNRDRFGALPGRYFQISFQSKI